VSPRTVRKYMPKLPAEPLGGPRGDQRWATFLENHARGIVACDFCVAVTATFRILYVLVLMEHASLAARVARGCHDAPSPHRRQAGD
jgi:putative transposase